MNRMKQEYWEHFTKTGSVEDYLSYKGLEPYAWKRESEGGKSCESVDRSDGDGAVGGACRRV